VKIFGYTKKDENNLEEMSEITVQGSPEQIVQLGNFFLKYADVMKKMGSNFSHAHIQDECKNWCPEFPDVIINR
jgi:hypothetical protein